MSALLLVLPALLLGAAVALTAWRGGAYPGERLLDRARRARSARAVHAPRLAAPHHHAHLPRPPRRVRPGGGALLARRLASRAPPPAMA